VNINISYVDISTDEELGLLKEALYDPSIKPFMAKLKDTSFVDDNLGDLIKEAFVDGDNRMFPKHTPEHALVSAIYAHYQPDVPDLIKVATTSIQIIFDTLIFESFVFLSQYSL